MRSNTPALDSTKKEHIGSLDKLIWSDPSAPTSILALTDGRVMVGNEHPDFFVRGQRYRFLGKWEDSAKRGPQFKFSTVVRDTPHSRPGLVKYLTDFAPNVGKITAEKLWDKYGGEAIRVLREEPGRVMEDRIMNLDQAKEAGAALTAGAALESTKVDLFSLFVGRGFPGKLIDRTIETWGAKAPEVIRRDPYKLLVAELPGAGWKRCDKLYADLGYPLDRLKRQTLFLWNALREGNDGHTWFDGQSVVKALREGITGANVNPKKAILLGKRAGWFRLRKDADGKLWIAETQKAINEAEIARHLHRLQSWSDEHGGETLWPSSIPVSQREGDGLPSQHQADQAAVATSAPVGLLCGGPGTGKTHTLAFILKALLRDLGTDEVAVCAPTGKAAVRATQSLSLQGIGIRATTIHRMLGIGRNGHDGKGWGFVHNEDNPLPVKVVIADETSMDDTDLMSSLLAACGDGTHVLFIGDPFQLPPVGHGAPLRDMIAAGVPYGELTQVRRNAGAIVHACVRIKNGEQFDTYPDYEPETGHNLVMYETANEAESLQVLEKLLTSMKRFDPVWATQVLVGVNKKSGLSRVEVNRRLHGLLNPDGFQIAGNTFRVGDKIICLKNSRMHRVEPSNLPRDMDAELDGRPAEIPPGRTFSTDASQYRPVNDPDGQAEEIYVANGEIGRVVAVSTGLTIARMGEADELIKIPMGKKKDREEEDREDGGEEKEGKGGGGTQFDLAYAVTCHKAQGSESPCVITLIDAQADRVSDRHWWYTACSRASKLQILIGSRAVLDRQRLRVSLVKRKTYLVELVRDAFATTAVESAH